MIFEAQFFFFMLGSLHGIFVLIKHFISWTGSPTALNLVHQNKIYLLH